MKDDKSRILPLLMDPRQPDENNRAYAYRILLQEYHEHPAAARLPAEPRRS